MTFIADYIPALIGALMGGLIIQAHRNYGKLGLVVLVPFLLAALLFYFHYIGLTWASPQAMWDSQPMAFAYLGFGIPAALAFQLCLFVAAPVRNHIRSQLIVTSVASGVLLPVGLLALGKASPGLDRQSLTLVVAVGIGAYAFALATLIYIGRATGADGSGRRLAAFFASTLVLFSGGSGGARGIFERSGSYTVAIGGGLGTALIMIGVSYVLIALLFAGKDRLRSAKPGGVVLLLGLLVLVASFAFGDGSKSMLLLFPVLLCLGGALYALVGGIVQRGRRVRAVMVGAAASLIGVVGAVAVAIAVDDAKADGQTAPDAEPTITAPQSPERLPPARP